MRLTPDLAVRPVFERSNKKAGTLSPQVVLPFLHFAEYVLNFATAGLIFYFVEQLLQLTFPNLPRTTSRHLFACSFLLASIVVIMLNHAGAYRASSGLLRVRETAFVLKASVLAMIVIAPSALLIDYRLALGFFLIAFPMLALLLVVEKHLVHTLFDAYRRRGLGLKRVLIYGSADVGRRLFATLSRSPRLGLFPVAVLDPRGSKVLTSEEQEFSSTLDAFIDPEYLSSALLLAHQADIVLIASADLSRKQMSLLRHEASNANASVIFAADIASEYTGPMSFTELDGEMLYGPSAPNYPLLHQGLSRMLDVVASSLLLVVLSPLLLLLYILIPIDSEGPIFFRQVRVGKDGELFTIYKFRSMHTLHCGDSLSPEHPSDARITRIGRILRKTSLDELPQLWNILQGDMALVGPRPEMPFIVADYTHEQRKRLAARPGLTGLWQISADRCRPIHENIHYDLYYLRNRSIYMDFAILFHTILFAMRGI